MEEKTERQFATAKFSLIYKGSNLRFVIDTNLFPPEMEEAVTLWLPNTKDTSANSLCDFIHSLNSEYRAYTERDKKIIQWVSQQQNITHC